MTFLRKHWFDVGGILSLVVLGFIFLNYEKLSQYELVMWFSLVSLFFHQLEEYRVVGTFPGMLNKVFFKSETPDRYPLNTQSAFCINVLIGWLVYFLAAVFAEKAVWLGIASLLISIGNVIAHTILFNIKGKTFYNAGLATSWLFFAPCAFLFFKIAYADRLITLTDYLIGIPLGVILNFVGILKMISWMKNKNTIYIFEQRNLLRRDRIRLAVPAIK